ncbi:leucyl/phenylalanyl-tRNA--protein transferase [Conexibacter sp. SYSU D00693]|uniref:leucyl/phenylalanyl-tRNA--protein transferase n=1 Tax=Conexibacter sp. SYSU D00693 TaxID=2812560 RepID=UPI00196B1507|nr:leucyl/phenylalanyl-tRNA--protein transferase [Conexibacter sp. SYSU D00693]
MDVGRILGLYALGLFPMDEEGRTELPWWTADPRTVFELDPDALAHTRRKVRRSVAVGEREGWQLRLDLAFDRVLQGCARPRRDGDGVWLTPRMGALYGALHAAGHAHSFELWDADGRELLAGVLAVTLDGAAMLESMFHLRPHAGNVALLRTLETLASGGCVVCDVQLSTPHLLRLGAQEISQVAYEERLRAAVPLSSGV